ncbi:MAG: YHS domain-containing (seleno)protein [Bacteroidota bacterium]
MKMLVMAAMLFVVATNVLAQKAEIFQKEGAAIRGYDVVAFFKEQKPVKGLTDYATQWKDATWRFSSQQNLDSFKVSPEKYAPQYGGYCAYGIADGHKAPTETNTWTVLDGKLYFNYNQEVKSTWDKDRPGYIEKANRNWEKIKLAE